jgi:hypothetical protein
MADIIRIWIATYGPDPNALDLDRRQNGYTLMTYGTPVIDPSEIDRWAANLLCSSEDTTLRSPTGTAGGTALNFKATNNGFGALLPAGQNSQPIVIDLPIGSVESPDVFPLRYSYQEIKLSAENVGEPIIFTYDYHNLIVLNSSGEQIRSYEKQIQTNTGGYADFEPIKRSPNNTIVFLTADEELYKVVGRNLLLISSFEDVYAFGFDSDSNLYVFEESTGSENNCFWYKFDSPDYTSFTKKRIFVNGYADPGYTWAMKGWYQVKPDGGFYFGTSENPDSDLRGDINQGMLYRHDVNGKRNLSVMLPIADGDFTSYHEVVTGIGEDEDGNILCVTHVEAETIVINILQFEIRTSETEDYTVNAPDNGTEFTVDTSGTASFLDRLYVGQVPEGKQVKITKIEWYYDDAWNDHSNVLDWSILSSSMTHDGTGWIRAYDSEDPTAKGMLDYIASRDPVDSWRVTYLVEDVSAGGEEGEGGEGGEGGE